MTFVIYTHLFLSWIDCLELYIDLNKDSLILTHTNGLLTGNTNLFPKCD